jgi:tetratricopeptide (TPR) repeat protein
MKSVRWAVCAVVAVSSEVSEIFLRCGCSACWTSRNCVRRTANTSRRVDALRLAHAYLVEVDDGIAKDIDEPSALANHRSTLALAARQLDIAARADPGTALEIACEGGPPTIIPQAVLRAALLTAEARTYALENVTKANALLTQATLLDPEHGPAHALLGHLYFYRRDKTRAIAAFERALALSPDDISLINDVDHRGVWLELALITDRPARC